MDTIHIEERYNQLADDSCCLSCGGAINYSRAMPGEVCADLGCGRGTDAINLAMQVGPGGFVYGIDIAGEMLDKASRTAQKLGVENVKFFRSDLENIDLPSGSVHLVISNCVINHANDKQGVWNEVFRILAPGGRFVVSDIYSLEPVPEKYRSDPQAVSECWAGASTRDEYLETLQKAGFTSIEIIEESKPYPKGEISVSGFTVAGRKKKVCSCCE